MIRSGITALSKDFGLSSLTTEDVIQTMINHIQQDVKIMSKPREINKQAEPLTDEGKILGLAKMVQDKATENNLNLKEVRLY